jgi:hypothetical protein
VNGTPPAVANAFSLQVNTKPFQTSVCSGAANPTQCQGWQQFVFSNSGFVFMQYWLLTYLATCPAGWNTYGADCWKNSSATFVPAQTINQLGKLSLTGNAVSGGSDTVIFSTGSARYAATGEDSALHLANGWQFAEFNVFGDCCFSQANFNTGSTIAVRVSVNTGSLQAPSCAAEGYTGETNNLYFVKANTVPPSGSNPAIVFTESTEVSNVSPCESASPVGAPVVYTYCIGEYENIAGGGCQNLPQQYWDCWHNSQDFSLGEGLCHSKKFAFFKTKRTQDPVGGDECGYSYGLMLCSNYATPDMSCSQSDNFFGCRAGSSKAYYSHRPAPSPK